MRSHTLLNVLTLAAMLLSLPAWWAPARPAAAVGPDAMGKVEELVLRQLADKGQADFLVWLAEKVDLSPAAQLAAKAEKGRFVFDALRATAQRSQQDLRAYLDAQGVEYRPYYIVNRIWVKGAGEALLRSLAARADVAQITANHTFRLAEPSSRAPSEAGPNYVEPNLSFVRADQVWAMGFTGQGMALADDDTGLDYTHPAIAPHYRGCVDPPACTTWDHNYNWWDAWGDSPAEPWDDFGHGTHTAGTMVGDDYAGNQIGMAPGAALVACKNMQGGGGDDAHFLICFEWNLAPWDLNGQNPRPELAPDAVNNSWGYWGGGVDIFREAIDNLLAAGIVVEVSAGGEGPGCQTLRSPADYAEVLTTGSIDHTDPGYPFPGHLTGFSARGPSILDEGYFPDLMAPGENIRSSVPGNGYEYWSGTSMAGPHVTALIALIWSANPALRGQIETTYDIILDTAGPLTGQGGSYCGGDYVNGPNNDWGYGTIDALAAVEAAGVCCGAGTLEGTVADAQSGLPISGATILAVRQDGGSWTDETDAAGFYEVMVWPGTFDITASHPHYVSSTANGVVVVEGETTVQDFSLAPRGWAFGTVTDYDNGTPIEGATITAEEGSLATADATGYYELWLEPGEHTLTAAAQDYTPASAAVTIVPGQGTELDFLLQAVVAFLPSPLEVSLELGGTLTQPATIVNRQAGEYAFEFEEWDQGYVPQGGRPLAVRVPAGPAAAPDGTAVAAGPYRARPAGSVPVAPRGSVNEPDVLLLAADDDNGGYSPIREMLLAYGDLGAVDLYDPRYSTPSLDELLAYDVVVVWANYPFADPAAIGDVLADYVDQGGHAIDLMFALDPNWGYQGRFRAEDYSAMTLVGTSYTTSCLGQYDPNHPIMAGITDVCDLYRGYGTALTAHSHEVARWQDGELFVAGKDNLTVASINGYVGVYYQWTGQMADLLHNAIFWLLGLCCPADVPWLAEEPASGVVPAEGSLEVSVLFDASPAAGVTQPGTYLAELILAGEPEVTVPVIMHVAGGGTLHVGGILGYFRFDPYGRPLLRMKVTAHDGSHSAVGDVAVEASIWSPAGGPFARIRLTKPTTGMASFHWGSKVAGTWQLCVDNLAKAGYTYAPGDNDVPDCASWDN